MSDITYNISMNISKGFLSSSIQANGVTASMSNAGLKGDTYTLSTNAISISTANLSQAGVAFMRNISTATSATVQIGIAAGGSFGSFTTLRVGEPAVMRLAAGTQYQAIGSSGARLRVDITEG
jgi:hypothetical protein